MFIHWFGQTCFKIQAKIDGEDVVVVTDPFSSDIGIKSPRLHADIVTISDVDNKNIEIEGANGTTRTPEPFLITGSGEYETKGLFVSGVDAGMKNGERDGNNVMYRYDIEGVRLVHLGMLKNTKLTDAQVEALGNIDVLMIPVGGGASLNAEQAVKVINILEPRLIIPMNFAVKGLSEKLTSVDDFTKEYGAGSITPENRIRITKSDLPQVDSEIKVLTIG